MVDNEIESTFVVGFKIDDSNLENQLNSIKNLIQNTFNQGIGAVGLGGVGGGQVAGGGAGLGGGIHLQADEIKVINAQVGDVGAGGQPPFAQAVEAGVGVGDINIENAYINPIQHEWRSIPSFRDATAREFIDWVGYVITNPSGSLQNLPAESIQKMKAIADGLEAQINMNPEYSFNMTMEELQLTEIEGGTGFDKVTSRLATGGRKLLSAIAHGMIGIGGLDPVGVRKDIDVAMALGLGGYTSTAGSKKSFQHRSLQDMVQFMATLMGKTSDTEVSGLVDSGKTDVLIKYLHNNLQMYSPVEIKTKGGPFGKTDAQSMVGYMEDSIKRFFDANEGATLTDFMNSPYKATVITHGGIGTNARSIMREGWKKILNTLVKPVGEGGIGLGGTVPTGLLNKFDEIFHGISIDDIIVPELMRKLENVPYQHAQDILTKLIFKKMLDPEFLDLTMQMITAESLLDPANQMMVSNYLGDDFVFSQNLINELQNYLGKVSSFNPNVKVGGGVFNDANKELFLDVNYLTNQKGKMNILNIMMQEVDVSEGIINLLGGKAQNFIKDKTLYDIVNNLSEYRTRRLMQKFIEAGAADVDEMSYAEFKKAAAYAKFSHDYKMSDLPTKEKEMYSLQTKLVDYLDGNIHGIGSTDELDDHIKQRKEQREKEEKLAALQINQNRVINNIMNQFKIRMDKRKLRDLQRIQNPIDYFNDLEDALKYMSKFSSISPINSINTMTEMRNYGTRFIGGLATINQDGSIRKRIYNFLFPFYQSGQLNTPEGKELLKELSKEWKILTNEAMEYLETTSNMDIIGYNSIFMEDSFTDIHADWLGNKSIDFFQKSNAITESLKLMTAHDIRSKLTLGGADLPDGIKEKAESVAKIIGSYGGLVRLGHLIQENLDGDIIDRGAKIPQNSPLFALGDTNGKVIKVMAEIKEVIAALYPEGETGGYDVFKNIEWLSSHSLNVVLPTDVTIWSNL